MRWTGASTRWSSCGSYTVPVSGQTCWNCDLSRHPMSSRAERGISGRVIVIPRAGTPERFLADRLGMTESENAQSYTVLPLDEALDAGDALLNQVQAGGDAEADVLVGLAGQARPEARARQDGDAGLVE